MTAGKKVIINTETTGLYPKDGHKLVEIAAIEIDENDIQTGAVFHAYINPERRISRDVTAVHGLDYKFLKITRRLRHIKMNFCVLLRVKKS